MHPKHVCTAPRRSIVSRSAKGASPHRSLQRLHWGRLRARLTIGPATRFAPSAIRGALLAVLVACGERATQRPLDAQVTIEDATVRSADAAPRMVPLLDHSAWRRYDAKLDPLASHQPPELVCADSATHNELASYEIDTARCNYVLSEHPALVSLAAGTNVHATLLHYDLSAPEPADAHVAILFGDALQWETHIPIPSAGDAIDVDFVATRALALGEPVRLHLHNHGGNTWLLVSLEALLP